MQFITNPNPPIITYNGTWNEEVESLLKDLQSTLQDFIEEPTSPLHAIKAELFSITYFFNEDHETGTLVITFNLPKKPLRSTLGLTQALKDLINEFMDLIPTYTHAQHSSTDNTLTYIHTFNL